MKESIKAPRHWPLCGEFTGTGEFPAQRASYAENISIWWCHHDSRRKLFVNIMVGEGEVDFKWRFEYKKKCKIVGNLRRDMGVLLDFKISPLHYRICILFNIVLDWNAIYRVIIMITSLNGNIFRVTGPLWGEFTGHWWIPLTKASNAELWCFLWSAPEQTVE